MDSLPLKQIIEGAILAAETPLSVDHLMQLFEGDIPERADVREALKEIEESCEGRGFELKKVASGYRFQVRSDYGEWVSRLWKERPPKYTRAFLETLALIAYKQPLTRGDIEEIRGVAVSTNIIRAMLEREWVRVVGHRDVPGHPALLATTKTFLDYFNLSSLDELPTLAEIRDLTKANEELDLDEELIEMRTLEVDEAEQEEIAGMDDADLDAVSNQVNEIQENIRNLFASDEVDDLEADLDDDDMIDEDSNAVAPEEAATPEAETSEETTPAPQSEESTEPKIATVTPISDAMSPAEPGPEEKENDI
jgi:segregation and condensation protein B